MEYKNIMSMEFPMSENILLDTLIILISAILAKIEGFYFSYFAEKMRHKTSISKNAQWCQLGTLQILILHGLMISNQSKTIVGPLTHGYLKLLPDFLMWLMWPISTALKQLCEYLTALL